MTDSSKDKIDEIFWRLSCNGGTEGINGSEAKQAIQSLINSAVKAARIEELKTAWGKNAPGDLGNGYMERRIKELSNTKEEADE